MEIRILTYSEIDSRKWNRCILESSNRLIYAEHEYLSHMAGAFDAVVKGDYEAVMPLTWRRKYGIRYLFQPAFCQQGGVFSPKKLTASECKAFVETAMTSFRFAEISINYRNILPADISHLKISGRNNFLLHLHKPYEAISGSYDSYIQQRLKRAGKHQMLYLSSDDYDKAIRIYKKTYQKRMTALHTRDFSNLQALCRYYHGRKRVVVREVWSHEKKQLLACILLLKDKDRMYNLASSVTEAGKKQLANYFLFDALIREFAGQPILLDFEGSNIPGVAYFYGKWADENQSYSFVKWNRLPAPLKLFKS